MVPHLPVRLVLVLLAVPRQEALVRVDSAVDPAAVPVRVVAVDSVADPAVVLAVAVDSVADLAVVPVVPRSGPTTWSTWRTRVGVVVPPQRRSRRRRRNVEELEPIQVATYMPSNAPVPDVEVIIEHGCTPQELGPEAEPFGRGDVIRFLFLQGEVVTATQSLTDDMIEIFAAEARRSDSSGRPHRTRSRAQARYSPSMRKRSTPRPSAPVRW